MLSRIVVAWVLVSGVSLAAPNAPAEVAAADVSAIKDQLVIWTDGKKHFIAMVMTSRVGSPIFWSSDGQSFYALNLRSGSADGFDDALKRLDRNFWEPRERGGEASLGYVAATQKLTVECVDRKTPMDRLAAAESKKLIDGARFYQRRWGRYAYALARDSTGKYYYVDNVLEPEGAKNFRLFAGPRGAMKPIKMLNVVSDSQGDIFSTAHGDLRLVLSKQDSSWIVKQKPTRLLWVPVDNENVLIYTELGVYNGERFGTPCDDL